ncbi:MAG: hypothetical protein NZM09_08240 [Ignavibacterium sp.]|nr:hypothetical protein [Ignavibacterium sp.]MDW8375671.1 hypothetical protein [Ignavibacteriales bacterium]
MNKYAYTLYNQILSHLDDNSDISLETTIGELSTMDFDELDWMIVINEMELIYGILIPMEIIDEKDLNILEVGMILSKLPKIQDYIYPEFYYLKNQIMNCLFKLMEIEVNEGSEENKIILEEQLELLKKRLAEITTYSLN